MASPDTKTQSTATPAPFFYGWWVVATAVLAGFMVYGTGLYSFTLFIRPLTEEFGWSRAMIGGAFSIFWIAAPLSLIAGVLIERVGIRRLIAIGVLLEGAALFMVGFVSAPWELFVLRALMGLGKVLVAVTIPILLSYWFSIRYGLALALALSGWHLGGLVLVPITQGIIEALGWRYAAFALGFVVLVTAVPTALWVLRFVRPAQLGLNRDGSETGSADPEAETRSDVPGVLVVTEVMKSVSFWIIMLAALIYYLTFASVIAHEAAFITEIGLSSNIAAYAVSLTAGMSMVGLLVTGIAIDRWRLRAVLITVFGIFLVSLVSLLGLTVTTTSALFIAFVLAFGFAGGGIDLTLITTVKRVFGERKFPHVYGILYFCLLAGFLVGPVLSGYLHDLTDSYQTAFLSVLVAFALAYIGLATLRIPKVAPPDED